MTAVAGVNWPSAAQRSQGIGAVAVGKQEGEKEKAVGKERSKKRKMHAKELAAMEGEEGRKDIHSSLAAN